MDVTITNDPARIAALRAKMQDRRPVDPLERLLRALPEKYDEFNPRSLALLRERYDEAVPRLLEIAKRVGLRQREGAMAMRALCALEEGALLPIARDALRAEGEAAACRSALMNRESRFLGADLEIRRILLAGLDSDDPGCWRKAVNECGVLAFPGVVERFVELLAKPEAPDRPHLAFALVRLDPSPANLKTIEALLLDGPPGDQNSGRYLRSVTQAAYAESPESRLAAIEILLRWLREGLNGVRPLYSDSVRATLEALHKAAPGDPRCLAIAVEAFHARDITGDLYRAAALQLIADADPALHRSICLEMLQEPRRDAALTAVRSLKSACARTGDEEVVAAIRAARVQHGESDEFNQALVEIGGAEAEDAAEVGLDGLSQMTRMRVLWRTRRIDPQAALDRMTTVGAIPQSHGLAEAVLNESIEDRPDLTPEPADIFLRALERVGVLATFSVDTDMIPPPYDELLLELGEAMRGRFDIEAVDSRRDLPGGISEEDLHAGRVQLEDVGCIVEFIHNGQLVEFRTSDLGDYYDSESVNIALNEALKAEGRRERFHHVNDEDVARLLLVTPKAAKVARDEFFVPVAGAPQARRKRKRKD